MRRDRILSVTLGLILIGISCVGFAAEDVSVGAPTFKVGDDWRSTLAVLAAVAGPSVAQKKPGLGGAVPVPPIPVPGPPPRPIVVAPTSCQDDLNSGMLTITGPTVSSITVNSAVLAGSVSVAPPPPLGVSYTVKLVWGKTPVPPFPNTVVTNSIPPPGPLNLSGPASLLPSTVYGARIEVTKAYPPGGVVVPPTQCNGPTISFQTPPPPICHDVTINLNTGQAPWTPGYITTKFGPWVTPAGGASWIQPVNSPNPQNQPAGNYQYTVPFTVPGPLSQYSSIQIIGQYAADNEVAFFMSGPTGVSCNPGNQDCFSGWHPLNIASGFLPGANSLTAQVHNDGSITGLIVNATLKAVCIRG